MFSVIYFICENYLVFFFHQIHPAHFHSVYVGQCDTYFFTMIYTVDIYLSTLVTERQWPFFSLSFLLYPRWGAAPLSGWWESMAREPWTFFAHRSTHTISHFFSHALPRVACIKCRFQILAAFKYVYSRLRARSWLVHFNKCETDMTLMYS